MLELWDSIKYDGNRRLAETFYRTSSRRGSHSPKIRIHLHHEDSAARESLGERNSLEDLIQVKSQFSQLFKNEAIRAAIQQGVKSPTTNKTMAFLQRHLCAVSGNRTLQDKFLPRFNFKDLRVTKCSQHQNLIKTRPKVPRNPSDHLIKPPKMYFWQQPVRKIKQLELQSFDDFD